MLSLAVLITIPCALGAILERQATPRCNADNCLRAVAGTQAGVTRSASRVNSDCASFQAVTVYQSTVTTTTTSGAVSTTITSSPISPAPGTVSPSSVPAYAASSCGPAASASSRFASACACAGVSKTTSIAPAFTVIVVQPVPQGQCIDPSREGPGGDGHIGTCTNGVNTASGCGCYALANGMGNICDQYGSGCGPACGSDGSCPTGTYCLAGSSTGCGANTCGSAAGFAACANQPAAAKRMLQRKDVTRRKVASSLASTEELKASS